MTNFTALQFQDQENFPETFTFITSLIFWTIIGIGLFDFIFQSFVILGAFISNLFEPSIKKISRKLFGVFITLVYIVVRLSVGASIIQPLLGWKLLEAEIFNTVFYASTTIIFVGVYFTGIFIGLIYLGKYSCTGKEATPKFRKVAPNEKTPLVAILMPIYNETPEVLFRAIDSMISVKCPRKHIFLSFDDEEESDLYVSVLRKFDLLHDANNNLSETPILARIDTIVNNSIPVTICRFPHGGKNSTQGNAFRIVRSLYGPEASNTFIFSTDSDTVLHPNALINFLSYAKDNPDLIAATGLLTCATRGRINLYQYMQNAEYIESQLFIRAGEAGLGAVTCMPGAMSLIKMESLEKVADIYYYSEEKNENESIFSFHRRVLGEDRYLTYLLTKTDSKPWQIAFVPNSICKTDPPDTFVSFLKQRRRWLLGAMACEIYMMTSPLMWKRFPFIQIYKVFIYESRSIDWFSWIILVRLLFSGFSSSSGNFNYFELFFPITVLFKYAIFGIFCICSCRFKPLWSYILLMIFMPGFTIVMVIYSIWTWNVRTWGGPRTDAIKKSNNKDLLIDNEYLDIKIHI